MDNNFIQWCHDNDCEILISEWDEERNSEHNLDLNSITFGSGREAYWKCHICNHSYTMRIADRTTGQHGCPECAKGKKTSIPEKIMFLIVKQYYEDAIENYRNSEILGRRELDIYIPSKNMAFEYDGSNWHNASRQESDQIKNDICLEHNIKLFRIRELGCAQLQNSNDYYIKPDSNYNSLIKLLQELLQQLTQDYTIDIDNTIVNQAQALSALKQVDNSLAATKPEILTWWDYSKNLITPESITSGSAKKVWWLCEKGHSFEMQVRYKVQGNRCPVCNNRKVQIGYNDLFTTAPDLQEDWDYETNTIDPLTIVGGCNKSVFWKCHICDHKWSTSPNQRVYKGDGCPSCGRKSAKDKLIKYNVTEKYNLAVIRPDIAAEWDYSKNKYNPNEVTPNSGQKVFWICSNGHHWAGVIRDRVRDNHQCPYCK